MNKKISQFSGRHKKDGTWVKDLAGQVGKDLYERFMVLESSRVARTRKGDSAYLTVTVGDKTGRVKLRVWQIPIIEEGRSLSMFEPGQVYILPVRVDQFKEQIQLAMDWPDSRKKWPLACQGLEDEQRTEIFPEDFDQISDRLHCCVVAEMLVYLGHLIERRVKHSGYQKILQGFWHDPEWKKQFIRWPAAKFHHHAFYHGLLQHVYEMLVLAEELGEMYRNALDMDLLNTAIILHDAAKILDYRLELNIEINEPEIRIGHAINQIRAVDRLVMEKKIKIAKVDLDRLYHLLASHHGDPADGLGSAVKPQTLEAVALHQLDMLSAQVNGFWLQEQKNKPVVE